MGGHGDSHSRAVGDAEKGAGQIKETKSDKRRDVPPKAEAESLGGP